MDVAPKRVHLYGYDPARGDWFPIEINGSGDIVTTLDEPISTRDAGPDWTPKTGVAGAAVTSADATGNVFITDIPDNNTYLVIDDLVIGTDTLMYIDIKEETSNRLIWRLFFTASGQGQITIRSKEKLTAVNKRIFMDASVAGNVSATVHWHSEA